MNEVERLQEELVPLLTALCSPKMASNYKLTGMVFGMDIQYKDKVVGTYIDPSKRADSNARYMNAAGKHAVFLPERFTKESLLQARNIIFERLGIYPEIIDHLVKNLSEEYKKEEQWPAPQVVYVDDFLSPGSFTKCCKLKMMADDTIGLVVALNRVKNKAIGDVVFEVASGVFTIKDLSVNESFEPSTYQNYVDAYNNFDFVETGSEPFAESIANASDYALYFSEQLLQPVDAFNLNNYQASNKPEEME